MLRATHIDLGPQHWTVPQQPSTSNPELALLIGIELYLSVGNLPPGKSDLTITSPPLPIEFGTPDVFREREFPIVLLSLTRSPAHRAVSFGEDPRMLELALTRARARLILFGDAGALARRGGVSSWLFT